jgi:signal transduction histidine kinase
MLMAEGIGHVHRAGVERYRRSGHGLIVDSGRAVEVPARTKHGDDIRVELRLSPLPSRGGGNFVLGVMRDVTDRKRVELLQFELARAQAARHEIETAIAAREQVLISLAENPSTERLDRLARALVDLKLIDAGLLALHVQEIDLVQLLRRAVGAARTRADGHRLVVRGAACVLVECDEVRIREVLDHLLDNAISHNARACLIEARVVRPSRDIVEVSVRDHGVGIPPDRRADLFQRYGFCRPRDRQSGAGLGLHLSRKLVEMHGGTLDALFPPTGGVCVTARLPMH